MSFGKTEFKFLIVEDNLGDLLLIEEYLKGNISKPTIYHASTFAKAIEFLGKNIEFDLILLDLTLPDAEGEQLVVDILKFAGHTPVLVLTGYLDQEFAIKTLSLGISDYLLKDELNASYLYKSIVYSIERKRSEKILKESNERYEILAQATSDTIWDWDIELDKIQYNDSFTRMFGYEESVAENTSKWWAIKVHPHDILKVNSQLNYSFKNHITNLQLEYRFSCSDNSYKYISDRAFIVFDNAGKPKRVIGAMQDITSRREAEVKIKHSEANLRAIFENTPVGVILVDKELKVISFNNKAKDLNLLNLNVDVELESGRNIYDYVETARKDIYRGYIDSVFKGASVQYDIAYNQHDGYTFYIVFLLKPVFEAGNIIGFCITGLDVSKEMNDEQLREFDRSNLKALINSTNDLMWSLDKDFNLITSNKAFDDRMQLMRGKRLESGESVFSTGYSEVLLNRFRAYYERAFLGESFTVVEYSEMPFEHWSEISVSPIDNWTDVVGAACYSRDISEKMRAEIERVELLKILQYKNKDLQQFSYIVSHNLRSHIAKISGLAFLLKIEPDHKINNLSLPECVEQEVTNLGNVVNDMNTILSFRDADQKQKDNISFNTELKLIEQVLENQISESNATITSNFQVKYIVTVKSYIYSIMFNLISNAIKYRQPNAPLAIHIETKQTENSICLSVSDNGLGIDLEKDGENLFGLYKRFHSSDIEGSGLGLSLVKTQTEALDGNIEVESIVNKGTTFKICLPINKNKYAIDK